MNFNLCCVVAAVVIFVYYTTCRRVAVRAVERIDAPNYNRLQSRTDALLQVAVGRIHPSIREICQYALEDGRRVRAVIALSIAGELGAPVAVAVEYVHAASLVVDDVIDGDTTRRGRPTVASKYGAAAAQLSSIHLVSSAFLELRRVKDDVSLELLTIMAETLRDLSLGEWHESQTNYDVDHNVNFIIQKKTSSLFEMAFLSSWLMRSGAPERKDEVRAVATQFGELFQIADDVDDLDSDRARGIKTNYAVAYGVNRAHARCVELAAAVHSGCTALEIDCSAIDEIMQFLLHKVKNNM